MHADDGGRLGIARGTGIDDEIDLPFHLSGDRMSISRLIG